MEKSKRTLISDLKSEVSALLRDKEYSRGTIYVYQAEWNKLLRYGNDEYFNTKTAEKYLRNNYDINMSNPFQKLDRAQRIALRSINVLDDYIRTGTISKQYRRISRTTWMPIHDDILSEYIKKGIPRDLSDSWRKSLIFQLGQFSHFLDSLGVNNIERMDYSHIERYIISLKDFSTRTKALRLTQLKYFMTYLYTKKYIENDYSLFIPKIRKVPLKLPQIWSEEQIDNIIGSIDRGNPVGKRDYAIFLLLARLGLRISDIVNLKFNNVLWKQNKISVCQQKTNEPLVLPISKEIGLAIIDYIKTARPYIESPYVFLRHIAPYSQLNSHNNFHSEFRKYLRRAKIKRPSNSHIGAHSFRHTFASNLVRNNIDIVTISNIIGHKHIDTTRVYLKVDIEQLRKCSLSLEDNTHEK